MAIVTVIQFDLDECHCPHEQGVKGLKSHQVLTKVLHYILRCQKNDKKMPLCVSINPDIKLGTAALLCESIHVLL